MNISDEPNPLRRLTNKDLRRLTTPPRTERQKRQQSLIHEALHLRRDLLAIIAILKRQEKIPNSTLSLAVDIIRNRLLTHPEIERYMREFDSADKLVQEFKGRIIHLDEQWVSVEFEIDDVLEVRQFPRTGFLLSRPLLVGQPLFVNCQLDFAQHAEELTKDEKAEFDKSTPSVDKPWRAMLKKAKSFSERQT